MATSHASGDDHALQLTDRNMDMLRRAALAWTAADLRRAADELDELHATFDLVVTPSDDARSTIGTVREDLDALDALGWAGANA